MKQDDEALTVPNARLLCGVYFCLLAVIITIIIDSLFYVIGVNQLIPTFQAVLLAAGFAALFGAIFGEKIIHCAKPYSGKSFLWGFLMVLAALPFYDVIFLYLLNQFHPKLIGDLSLGNIFIAYLSIILYSFLFAGLWLAIVAGFAAMYLRGHIVYDILHSKNDKLKEPHKTEHSKPEIVKQRVESNKIK
ncbi:MAG: hypothetical protein H0U57_01450 [Tatlockia sp.]|nr:hypothetical protein [Tatlockia sp.]